MSMTTIYRGASSFVNRKGLFDEYGFDAIFSFRLLHSNADSIVEIRNATTNNTKVFGKNDAVGGWIQPSTITGWLNGDPGRVVQFFDQTGNGNRCLQSTNDDQPFYATRNGYPACAGQGGYRSVRDLDCPAGGAFTWVFGIADLTLVGGNPRFYYWLSGPENNFHTVGTNYNTNVNPNPGKLFMSGSWTSWPDRCALSNVLHDFWRNHKTHAVITYAANYRSPNASRFTVNAQLKGYSSVGKKVSSITNSNYIPLNARAVFTAGRYGGSSLRSWGHTYCRSRQEYTEAQEDAIMAILNQDIV